MKSEIGIICGIAAQVVPSVGEIPWADFADDYSLIRQRIGRVADGYEDFEERLRANEGGFLLAHAARDKREFKTSDAKAQFSANDLSWLPTEPGRLLLQTMRSHDQFNTTIYGLQDRYRGVNGTREVVFVNPDDLAELGLKDGDVVDIVSEFRRRRAAGGRVPAGVLPDGARLRRGVLPGDQRPDVRRRRGQGQQHPGRQGPDSPAGTS